VLAGIISTSRSKTATSNNDHSQKTTSQHLRIILTCTWIQNRGATKDSERDNREKRNRTGEEKKEK